MRELLQFQADDRLFVSLILNQGVILTGLRDLLFNFIVDLSVLVCSLNMVT
jgi:hypothetical protein